MFLDFRWLRRADTSKQIIVELPPETQFRFNSSLENEIIRTVANAIVAEHGQELIETIIGEGRLDKAIKERVVNQIMGDPRDYRR